MELGSLTHLLKEAKTVEYPFINVLIHMESLGIKVDQERLRALKGELSEALQTLTEEIYALAGTEFNIRSTQQLGVVLFQQLGLKGGKKTKTGYSTNEAVLNALKGEHPIIEKILSYREYQKMLSTYVEPLLKLAKSDDKSRIYTSFLQIISSYFASFPTVKRFLEGIQEQVKIDGFVETILGRRRFFDYENANGMQKAAFMRESVNTVFQGSAADLIKLSMLQIDTMIEDEKLDAHMLLQIHDELIFEIAESEVERIGSRFVHTMENIYPLNVPLECSLSVGENWGELK